MLRLLYCIPLLFQVLHRNDLLGSGGYIVYHCCLRFPREEVHVVVCYIVDHYCLMFDRGVVDIVVLYCLPLMFKVLIEKWFMSLLLYCIP